MLDFGFLPSASVVDQQVFVGTNNVQVTSVNATWEKWEKPRGCAFVHILCIGAGGNGGNGAVGAASTAAGGGGGASGCTSSLLIPAGFLPEQLSIFSTVPMATGPSTYVTFEPTTSAGVPILVIYANGGGFGGNASGATGGAAGATGTAANIASCPLCNAGASTFYAGNVGIIGGTTGAGGAKANPPPLVMGGTGGGGLGATTGSAGGAITGFSFAMPGGVGATVSGTAGSAGSNGCLVSKRGFGFMAGTGGGSGYANAGGAGGAGGAGAIGCGGGGGGGGFTGSTAAVGGSGGPGAVIITAW